MKIPPSENAIPIDINNNSEAEIYIYNPFLPNNAARKPEGSRARPKGEATENLLQLQDHMGIYTGRLDETPDEDFPIGTEKNSILENSGEKLQK